MNVFREGTYPRKTRGLKRAPDKGVSNIIPAYFSFTGVRIIKFLFPSLFLLLLKQAGFEISGELA